MTDGLPLVRARIIMGSRFWVLQQNENLHAGLHLLQMHLLSTDRLQAFPLLARREAFN